MAPSEENASTHNHRDSDSARDDLNTQNSVISNTTPTESGTRAPIALSTTPAPLSTVDNVPSDTLSGVPSTPASTMASTATVSATPVLSSAANNAQQTQHNPQQITNSTPAYHKTIGFTGMDMLKTRKRDLVAGVKRSWKEMSRSTESLTSKSVNTRILHNRKVTELIARIIYQTSNNLQLHLTFTEFKTRREEQLQQIKMKANNLNQAKLHLLTAISPGTSFQAQIKQEHILDEEEVEAEEIDLAVLQLQQVEGLSDLMRWVRQLVRSDATVEEILEAVDQIELSKPNVG